MLNFIGFYMIIMSYDRVNMNPLLIKLEREG